MESLKICFSQGKRKKATGMALFSTLFMMIQNWENFVETEISNALSPDKVAIPDGDEEPRTCPDQPGIM